MSDRDIDFQPHPDSSTTAPALAFKQYAGEWEVVARVGEGGKLTLEVSRPDKQKVFITDDNTNQPETWRETFATRDQLRRITDISKAIAFKFDGAGSPE